ncbi:MAG TPA: hypothetical protein VGS19_03560 [Streptosporangiaceae bacterium]|nr:hypothetical protein [Streptosporangiaceae bacterium]
MYRCLWRLAAANFAATGLTFGVMTGAAGATPIASAVPDGNGSLTSVVCSPALTGGAFPYTASTKFPPPMFPTGQCGNTFAWGYTVSGNATGQAEWDSPNAAGMTCSAQAWIPDSDSNDPNAQYFFFDGSHYLGNDAFINQEKVTNNWVNITNNGSFPISSRMRVTLNDHNPFGQSGKYEAAYAVKFICT